MRREERLLPRAEFVVHQNHLQLLHDAVELIVLLRRLRPVVAEQQFFVGGGGSHFQFTKKVVTLVLPPRLPDVAGFDSAYLVLATSMVLEGGAIGADHWRLPNLRKGSTIVIEYD